MNYRSEKFEEVYANEGFDLCFDTTNESLKMAQIIKAGGRIVTIAGTPTLESMQLMTGGNPGCLINCVIPGRSKRAEFIAAQAGGAEWEHLFLQPSRADLEQLAKVLEAGTVKPVLDAIWDLNDDDPTTGWEGAFAKATSGRAMGKCVIRICQSDAPLPSTNTGKLNKSVGLV